MPVSRIDCRPHPRQYLLGGLVIALTVTLYILFW